MNSKNTLGHFHLRLEPKCAKIEKEKTKLSQNVKSFKIFIHVLIYRCIHTHVFSVYISTRIPLTDISAIYLHICVNIYALVLVHIYTVLWISNFNISYKFFPICLERPH